MDADLEKSAQSSTTSGHNRLHTSKKRPLDTTKWMASIDDETLLSNLTIPGTHDSAAYTKTWAPFVQTQTLPIRAQLRSGIRYFDLRCTLRNNVLEMCHGIRYLNLTLASVLQTIYTFLSNHPSEALVVQIKQDRRSQNSSVSFAEAVIELLTHQSSHWRTANTPTILGELRGRIQLFRRFNITEPGAAYGIDVTEWQDNPTRPFTIYTSHSTRLTIQDHYSFPSGATLPDLIRKKGGAISELLTMASKDPDPWHWYVNFTSAYELSLRYQIPPRPIAAGGWWGFRWEEGVNVRLRGWLEQKRRGRFGIVAMDFPEVDGGELVEALVKTNFRRDERLDRERMRWLVMGVVVLLYVFWILWRGFGWWMSGGPRAASGVDRDGLDAPVQSSVAVDFVS
ncbi:uncharacterized protein LTR77_005095 [Saxophila tyrrhenica]|uniref:Phosphatidylinositol-specific phospholipase C X domain-containing protein n=1 Tax=Saxophila tyrrhenica TaxID=1690608 RepID=A0AAV9PE46_9PEZI|nr:hypothetical protein LTR77_005095 [Saxophila tyrrhenica]